VFSSTHLPAYPPTPMLFKGDDLRETRGIRRASLCNGGDFSQPATKFSARRFFNLGISFLLDFVPDFGFPAPPACEQL
jgi:hypothetical protein